MIISRLHVQRFRSIYDETLECDPLTILIGRNGAGKSAFIQALRVFMDTSATLRDGDYYNRNAQEQILIEVTFSTLTSDEVSEFASYIDGGVLVVQRRFPGGDYYGMVSGCEDFELIRERLRQKAKVGDVAPDLKRLVDSGKYPGLKAATRGIEEELNRWEQENPTYCKRYFRSGIFQGPTNIAVTGRLKPASKERFKTSHFDGVEFLLKKGGTTHGESYQSGCYEFNHNALRARLVPAKDRPGA